MVGKNRAPEIILSESLGEFGRVDLSDVLKQFPDQLSRGACIGGPAVGARFSETLAHIPCGLFEILGHFPCVDEANHFDRNPRGPIILGARSSPPSRQTGFARDRSQFQHLITMADNIDVLEVDGRSRNGRPKGSVGKIPKVVKEALLLAADDIGFPCDVWENKYDGEGSLCGRV